MVTPNMLDDQSTSTVVNGKSFPHPISAYSRFTGIKGQFSIGM